MEESMKVEGALRLEGDLNQMWGMKRFLTEHGFQLGQSDVYPIIKKEDVIQALHIIYIEKPEGWWHYKEKYIKFEVCTKDGFKSEWDDYYKGKDG